MQIQALEMLDLGCYPARSSRSNVMYSNKTTHNIYMENVR
jgi:hypothetical protein